jgi:opacity protein-like surface antigen
MTIRAIGFFVFLFPLPSFGISGKTADGCTYRIINGQYLTSCDDKKPAAASASPSLAAAPVTDYGSVPVRSNTMALPPPPPAAPPQPTATLAAPARALELDSTYDLRRRQERDKAVDTTYVGAHLGSTTIKEAGADLGLGVTLGTYIDDHYGFELGYSYTKQDLNLGLDQRSGGELKGYSPRDAALSAHLISGEFQGYLTDTFKRLRPYLGLGLGWKSSTLGERNYEFGGSGGSLSQSSLGGLSTAGAKLRLGKAMQLGFAFRYFFPLLRQDPRLEQPKSLGFGAEETRLSRADDTLTGAAQYQILGGLQYAF